MKVGVLADQDTVTGFRLAGVNQTRVVESSEDVEDYLKEFKEDIAVLIITERLAEENREAINKFKEGDSVFPVLVEIPDKFGSAKETEIKDLIKKAIGIEVELEEIEGG